MEYREINLTRRNVPNEVFIIPRSKDANDYAIITPMNEEELLRKGITGDITFYSYEPVREEVEAQVKEYLQQNFQNAFKKNKELYRKIKFFLIAAPIAALIFVFTGFIDDIIIDIAAVFFFLFLHRFEKLERSNIKQIETRIHTLKIKENPLLTAIFRSFQELDSGQLQLPDIESFAARMSEHEIASTLAALGSFLHLDKISSIRQQLSRLERASAGASGWKRMQMKALRAVKRWQLRREQRRLQDEIGFRPGYRDIYELLLNESAPGAERFMLGR